MDDKNNNDDNNVLNGRRIINVDYFLNSLQSIKHELFNCSIQNVVFKSEIKNGFFLNLIFNATYAEKKK